MDAKQNLTTDWQDSVNFLLGLGLFLSPWALGYETEGSATLSAHIVGVIIAVMALAALFAFRIWEEWISVVLGAWLIAAPWVLNFSGNSVATRTHVLIGIAALGLATWSAAEHGSGHLSAGR